MIVEIAESELTMRGYTPATFWRLPLAMRRWLASNILRNRADENSQFSASMMERGNPNFNDFVILSGV